MKDEYWDEEFKNKLHNFFSLSDDRNLRASGRTTILSEILLKIALESGREVRYDVDHFVDARAKQNVAEDTIRRVHDIAHNYRSKFGVEIRLEVDRRRQVFKAYQLGSSNSERFNFSPFPIEEMKKQIKYLNNRKLLLL